jgi:hypothetical protein
LQRGEIAFDLLKYVNHEIAVLPGNAGKRFSVRRVHQPLDPIDERFAPDVETDAVRAAIGGILTSTVLRPVKVDASSRESKIPFAPSQY